MAMVTVKVKKKSHFHTLFISSCTCVVLRLDLAFAITDTEATNRISSFLLFQNKYPRVHTREKWGIS